LAKVIWRRVLETAAAAATLGVARRASARNTIVVLSDVHIGDKFADGVPFRDKSGGDVDDGPPSALPKFGHPFFVLFVT